MERTIITSREFNQDVSKAKRASLKGPVFITDRGQTSHVLLSLQEYQKITNQQEQITDLLAMPEATYIDFDPPKINKKLFKPADLD